jgi:hypothetical protein
MAMTGAPTSIKECAHHWMLPRPGGPTSNGICKFCGAEREFSNTTASGWVARTGTRKK